MMLWLVDESGVLKKKKCIHLKHTSLEQAPSVSSKFLAALTIHQPKAFMFAWVIDYLTWPLVSKCVENGDCKSDTGKLAPNVIKNTKAYIIGQMVEKTLD